MGETVEIWVFMAFQWAYRVLSWIFGESFSQVYEKLPLPFGNISEMSLTIS